MSRGAEVDIELVATATDDLRELIGELDQVLAAEYLPEQQHGLALEALFQPHIRFFVARLNGAAIGCGGIALFDDFAEVKRMYVRETVRGRGVAQTLLTRIETEARAAGFVVLRLETGERQAAALRLMPGPVSGLARRSATTPRCGRKRSRPASSWKSG